MAILCSTRCATGVDCDGSEGCTLPKLPCATHLGTKPSSSLGRVRPWLRRQIQQVVQESCPRFQGRSDKRPSTISVSVLRVSLKGQGSASVFSEWGDWVMSTQEALRVELSSNHDSNPSRTRNVESTDVECSEPGQATRRWRWRSVQAMTFDAYADTELDVVASYRCTNRFRAEAPFALAGALKLNLGEDILPRLCTYVPAAGAFEVPWVCLPLTHDARPVGSLELLIRFVPAVSFEPSGIINEIRATGIKLQELVGHSNSVLGCAAFPAGDKVLTVSSDHRGIIWDVLSGDMLRELNGHTDWVTACAVFPSGDKVVTVSFDKSAIIWDVQSGNRLFNLVGHSDWIKACAVFPAGDRLVTTSCDRRAIIWDARSGSKLLELIGHSDWVKGCAVFPDGDKVVTVSADRKGMIWSSRNGSPGSGARGVRLHELTGHQDAVKACCVFPSGDRVITVSRDKTGIVWDAKTGERLHQLVGHTDWIHGCAILVGRQDHTPVALLTVLDASKHGSNELQPERTPETILLSKAAKHSSGLKLVTVSSDQTAIVWDAYTGQKLQDLTGHGNSVQCCAALPEGEKVLTVSGDEKGIIWDVRLAENF
mmetsp:Transcript_77713/g.134814  ORF Transcript_77713/g.134814 Transcript_77713/m.134814 type:complete len:596 (+) Transcript_77713:64-1851(+)